MTRSGVPAAFSNASLTAFFAVELEFTSGTLRFWNGYGDLTVNGDTYTGSGDLLGISAIEETAEIGAKGATVTMSGIPSYLLSIALAENYRNRTASIYVGTIDGATVESYKIFSGRMDMMDLEEQGETCAISLQIENKLIDLERSRVRRYTSEDQKALYSGDKGFEFVNSLQEANIKWGGG